MLKSVNWFHTAVQKYYLLFTKLSKSRFCCSINELSFLSIFISFELRIAISQILMCFLFVPAVQYRML